MPARIRTTEEQRVTYQKIARLLLGHGMTVHPVSRRSRQHSFDFIAVQPFNYSNFILVQMRNGWILIRSYTTVALNGPLKSALKNTRWSVPVIVSDQLLRKPYGKTEWWRLFFPFKVVQREFPVLLAASREPERRHRKESRP